MQTETAGNDWLHTKHQNVKHTTQPEQKNLLSHFTDTTDEVGNAHLRAKHTVPRAVRYKFVKKCDGDDGPHCRRKTDHRCVGGGCNSAPYSLVT